MAHKIKIMIERKADPVFMAGSFNVLIWFFDNERFIPLFGGILLHAFVRCTSAHQDDGRREKGEGKTAIEIDDGRIGDKKGERDDLSS